MESFGFQMVILLFMLDTFTALPSSSIGSSSSLSSSSTSSPLPLASSLSATAIASSLTSAASEAFPGLTFEPHVEPNNLTGYIEALHSVPDHVFDNAAIIAAMDSDDFNRDMYSRSGLSPQRSSSTARIGELYSPEEMYQEEFSPSLLDYASSMNRNTKTNENKYQPTFGFHQPTGKQHSLMGFNYNELFPGTSNMGPNNLINNNNNNNGPYNGVHLISNLVPKQNGYSDNGRSTKTSAPYNAAIQTSPSQSQHVANSGQDSKNIDIDINTIRGILFQVLKHLDSQELSKNLDSAKGISSQANSGHHQQSTYQQQPAKKRTSTLNLYQPAVQPYSSSSYTNGQSTGNNAPHRHQQYQQYQQHQQHPSTNYGNNNNNNKQSYMSHVPLAYTGKPERPKNPNHSVGYPTTVEIAAGNQGLIAIPLPPNVVKFNYFGKGNGNIGTGYKSNLNDNYSGKKKYSQAQPLLPQTHQSKSYSSFTPIKSSSSYSVQNSVNKLNGKNCNRHHHHHHLAQDDSYASASSASGEAAVAATIDSASS
uniref:Uncharacterized protein n=1 Tax=Tetranychus urticae TaxID=32264 RepID=T1JRJ7_TETUR